MAIEEVTQWATATKDNIAHHPTGPLGRDAVRISTSFRELQAAIARWRDTLGSGGTPGGSTTQIQYNNAGAFGGIADFTYDGSALLSGINLKLENTTIPALEFRDSDGPAFIDGPWKVEPISNQFRIRSYNSAGTVARDVLSVTRNQVSSPQLTQWFLYGNAFEFTTGGGTAGDITMSNHDELVAPDTIRRTGGFDQIRIVGGSSYLSSASLYVNGNTFQSTGGDFGLQSNGTNVIFYDKSTGILRLSGGTSPVTAIDITAGPNITMYGAPVLPAATTSIPSLNMPHGTAPTTPTNGDLWTTTAGVFARVNGTTVDLTATGGGGGGGSGAWELILEESPSSDPSYWSLTWDESLYDEVYLVWEGIQPQTDNEELYITFATGNDTTNIGSGYSVIYTDYNGNAYSSGNGAWIDESTIAEGTTGSIWLTFGNGNGVGEVCQGWMRVRMMRGTTFGCEFDGAAFSKNGVGTPEYRGFRGNTSVAGDIDTIRFGAQGVSSLLANTGTFRLYGLRNDGAAAGSAAGGWHVIDSTDISGSPTEHKITWDEAVYSDIKVVISGIQCAVDGITLSLELGEANGATMHTTSGDYDGINLSWDNTTSYSQITPTDRIPLVTSTGNVAGETINGTINIMGTSGTDVGAMVNAWINYKNSSGNTRVFETKAFTDDGVAGAVDTYKLVFHATTDRAWANVGNVKTYGLKK